MQDKRNVMVILCDQLRPDFLNIYGCEAVPTPNIDGLAKNGVVFTNAITQSPVCAPARASMMTGRYVSDHGVWTNDVPFREGIEDYLPQRMNDLGYNTGAFGKLHHFPAKDSKGFKSFVSMEEGRLGNEDDYFIWLKEKHPEVNRIFNCENYTFKLNENEYYEHFLASKTIEFIEENTKSNSKQPFFAWVSFQGPHDPIDPPKEVKGTVDFEKIPKHLEKEYDDISPVVKYRKVLVSQEYSEQEILERRKAYCENIVAIDKQIGRIIETLKKLNLYEDTTIIFSADHGDMLYDYGINTKGPYIYHGQLAIPMIISNHPNTEKNSKNDSLVGNIDIPATVLDIAGDKSGIANSLSMLELTKQNPEYEREVNFSEFCDSMKLVENKRYRYCYYPFTGYAEMYDRINDPEERYNLVGKSEYHQIEIEFLRHIIEFGILSKGLRIESHDFVPETQAGVYKKFKNYKKDFKVAFPIFSKAYLEKLKRNNLSTDYNEFCKGKEILAHYGYYWK